MSILRRRSGYIGKQTSVPSKAELWKTILSNSKADFDKKWSNSGSSSAGHQQGVGWVPTSLSDFDVLVTLGTGSFGRVVLVRSRASDDTAGGGGQHFALKILNKAKNVHLKQVEHILRERKILPCVSFPFIVNLVHTFKDNSNVYMVLEYVPGGEMFTYLRRSGRFCEEQARFYASQLVLALEYLHHLDIVYRDLKPENLLLGLDGYLKIVDFGFSKRSKTRTYTLCGTPDYLAPEIILARGYSFPVDWWALGVLIFEMVAGYPPFFSEQPIKIYEKIIGCKVSYLGNMTPELIDLLRNLLQIDLTRRFGCLRNGVADIKEHRWFTGTDWFGVYLKNVR
jgi:protein kinase A